MILLNILYVLVLLGVLELLVLIGTNLWNTFVAARKLEKLNKELQVLKGKVDAYQARPR